MLLHKPLQRIIFLLKPWDVCVAFYRLAFVPLVAWYGSALRTAAWAPCLFKISNIPSTDRATYYAAIAVPAGRIIFASARVWYSKTNIFTDMHDD